jgi:diguanylate cyclase (GGDEF)-like protein
VCRKLKTDQHTEKIPIVFITSKDEEADETKGLGLGAIDYVTKPFSIPIVKARVKNLMQMKMQQDILENLSSIDGLTGIPNRRYFDQELQQEWKRATRSQTPLSVIMMDIDFFKKYNDHYGHPSGDECLRSVAKALSGTLHRSQDIIARYGGEEFIALLPDTEIAGALTIGEGMRQNVKNLQIPHAQSLAADYVTISAGIANIVPTNEYGSGLLIEGADKALYKAKNDSRNICKTCSIEDMLDL